MSELERGIKDIDNHVAYMEYLLKEGEYRKLEEYMQELKQGGQTHENMF